MRRNTGFLMGILLLLGIIQNPACAQFIVAGISTTGDFYSDVSPDSLLEASPYHNSNHPGEPMELDTDSDGVNDILISTWGGGGLGGGGGNCIVTPLIPNAEIVAHWDTSQGCCPQQYVALVADTMLTGDTISSLKAFHSGAVYVWSTTYGAAQAPIVFQWNDIGEHFIGFRLCYSFDTLYGWIRVEVTDTSFFIISVMDFACNRNTHIGITEARSENYFFPYPNPFTTKLSFDLFSNAPAELTLYSIMSVVEVKQEFTRHIDVNTECLGKGIYFYELRTGSEIRKGKIIKE